MKTPVVSLMRQASAHHGLRVNYHPTLALFRVEEELIRSTNTVLQLKAKDRFSQAKPDELRWRVITHTSAKTLPLSTQRNRLRRRWAAAFEQSLKRQGLGHDGKKAASQVNMPHTPEIVGTLELVIFEGYGFDEAAEELLKQTNHVVQALLRAGEGTRRMRSERQDVRGGYRGGGRW